MCLAVPGKLIEIIDDSGLKTGRIDYSGTVNTVCLELVPDIQVGQYTIVHAGFALSIIDEEEAQKSLEAWAELLDKTGMDGTALGIPTTGQNNASDQQETD